MGYEYAIDRHYVQDVDSMSLQKPNECGVALGKDRLVPGWEAGKKEKKDAKGPGIIASAAVEARCGAVR